MTPFVNDPDFTLLVGDALETLQAMPAESVHCCVTSPPYWGLRDYGTGAWAGGDADCDHMGPPKASDKSGLKNDGRPSEMVGQNEYERAATVPFRDACGKCGATRVDQQLGLEPTPDQYVANMVNVFREVRRVLRADGTLWLNIGDSYNSPPSGRTRDDYTTTPLNPDVATRKYEAGHGFRKDRALKPKDLVGIPWRLAQALQAPYYTGKIKDERDRIWLSAMVEAEGCMFIHRRKAGTDSGAKFTKTDGTEVSYSRTQDTFGSGLEVASTDRVIAERCMAIAGIGSISEQTPEQNPRRKQTIYRWNVRSNECRGIIRELYPHMIAKQHEARLLLGCPSSGDDARKAWESLKAIHQGETATIDFAPPEGMWERGWFLRSEIIWAKLDRTPCRNPSPIALRKPMSRCSC